MLSILTDTQKAVVDTITMRLHLEHALDYVKHAGFPMGRRTYYRHKKKIQEMKLERMHHIAKYFPDQHLERIDNLRTILKEMWKNYKECKDPFKRVQILEKIEDNQLYLSSYYDSTRFVLQEGAKMKEEKHEKA